MVIIFISNPTQCIITVEIYDVDGSVSLGTNCLGDYSDTCNTCALFGAS